MARLDAICALNMGQSPASSSYNETGDGLPFFQGNADFGELHPVARVWCNEPTKIAQRGDILISVRAPIGALNIADAECCIGRGLAAITVDERVCLRNYLWHAIASKIDELNAKGTGSTFKAISKSILGETDIPLPSLEEQKYIAEMLDRIGLLIFLRKQQLAKLDELVKARFVEMFGDPVKNEKGWQKQRLGNISTSRLGKMLDAKQQTGKCSFPYLANFNVQWFHFDTDNLNMMDFSEADQEEFRLEYGDLLVCEGGEIGRCAVWHDDVQPCYFQKALHRIRCNRDIILPDYLAWWFKFECECGGFDSIAGAKATIAHLPGVKLKSLDITTPPVEQQNQFAVFISQVDKSKAAVQKALDEAQLLFDSLMQKFFS